MRGKITGVLSALFLGVLLTAFMASDTTADMRKGMGGDEYGKPYSCPEGSGYGMMGGMGMMGMRHGMGGMHKMMTEKVDIDVKETADGVTITLKSADKTAQRQLKLMAEMMKLYHEMMKLQMEQMEEGK